ncbi:MAG: DUF58 domain-containing protein [Byssovorax sp.]
MDINFARLNHILIPETKAGRDRWRRGLMGRALAPIGAVLGALSDEGRTLALASLIVGGFGLDVHVSEVYLLWAALVALLAGSLAVHRFFRLNRVRVELDVPRRVTIGDELRFGLLLYNDGDEDVRAIRTRGPFLPWDGRWTAEEPRLGLLAAGRMARVETAARFEARGEHHLDPFSAAALVPFGLAVGPSIQSSGCKFLVVPRIARVERLTTPLGRRHQPGGVALASKTGESMDLLGVRPYRPGDPVRHLHAKSWARHGAPVVREYQEEYFSRIGVVVDTATPDSVSLEAAISLAAGVVARLSRGEALIDLLVVGGEVHDLTIGRHLGFLEQALDLLACVERSKDAIAPDVLLSRLVTHLPRLSCVIVVTAAWDEGQLAERIQGHGVGCSTLIVESAAQAGRSIHGPGLRRVSIAAIERGEALSL